MECHAKYKKGSSNVRVSENRKSKHDTRVPLGIISNRLDGTNVQKHKKVKNDVFHASYSLISAASFYEISPFQIKEEQEHNAENEGQEDITHFGFDLGRHARFLYRRESVYQPKPNYMKWQPFLSPKMRMVLLHWLTEVCEEFGYHRETWYVAVNCVDRFLSCVPKIALGKLQLIGVAAMLVASKMEEDDGPNFSTLKNLCDGAYEKHEIAAMEHLMLQKIGWLLLPVTPYHFLRIYLLMLLKAKHLTTDLSAPLAPIAPLVDPLAPLAAPLAAPLVDPLAPQAALTSSPNSRERESAPQKGEPDLPNRDGPAVLFDVNVHFPKNEFSRMMQIVDIAMMDHSSLKYKPSLIAAAVLHLIYDSELILAIYPDVKNEIEVCVEWLRPFSFVSMPKPKFPFEDLNNHFLQTSNLNVKVFLENHLI